nr:hypothetical protein [Brachyspira hyodysenteriae]
MVKKYIDILFKNNNVYEFIYNIIKYLFTILVPIMPYSSPYDIRINFIIYRIAALAIGAVNLFFAYMDYKAS